MPEQKVSPALIVVGGLGLGLVAAVGVYALSRAAGAGQVAVALRNPPSEAENWSLKLTDWGVTVPIHEISGKDMLDIAEAAAFEIPGGLTLPLRVLSLQITKWNEDMTALIVLYEIQSYRPYLWDFDLMDWSDVPDPSYREVFIPVTGDYFYNVATEIFET